jgi:outer membrane protein TolC
VREQELNLGYATIRSPVTGLASRALQRQGAYINSLSESAKLTYVAAINPIWVNFSVSQNQIARVRELVGKGQLTQRVGALRNYARLSRVRFDNGAASYVEVLVAENDLFTAELNAVSTQADRLTQLINVYKAMGGGWVDMADAIASPQHE